MKFEAGHNRILNQGGLVSLSLSLICSLALVTCWAHALDSHPDQSLSFWVPVCLATFQPLSLMSPAPVLLYVSIKPLQDGQQD